MADSPEPTDVECPECGGTGRVPRREPRCEWCTEGVAEHACADCEIYLCEACVSDGLCPACNPEAYLADVYGLAPEEAAA